MKSVIKIVLAIFICAAVIAAAFMYMKKITGSQKQGGPGNGAPGGKAPVSMQGAAAKNGKSSESGMSAKQGVAAKSENLVSVRTLEAQDTPLQDYVNTTGEIEPTSSIDVFPDIGGKVQEVFVNLGSYVKKGDKLLTVDPSTPGTKFALNTVRAPITGTVTALKVKTGNTVTGSTVVVTLGNVDELQITASVPERSVASLKTGLKADVVLEAYAGLVFPASVVRISPVVDPASRTKSITLEFDSNDSRVNAGMFAKVKLYTELYTGYPVIPETAVLTKSNMRYIYVVKSDGKTVTQREVTLGKTVDGFVQLLSGVSMGERMVTEGMNSLGEGSAIRDITAN